MTGRQVEAAITHCDPDSLYCPSRLGETTKVLHVVVNRERCQQPLNLYRDIRRPENAIMQFIPQVEIDGAGNLSAASVRAEEWGTFLCAVFDLWVREDIGKIQIRLFETTLAIWRGFPPHPACSEEDVGDACRPCPVLRFCRGDCPKHRLSDGKSALCAGYQRFFVYSAPYMKAMRDLLKHRRSPIELMVMLNQCR